MKHAAEIEHIPMPTLYRWIKEGRLRAKRRPLRVDPFELARLVDTMRSDVRK